MQLSPYRLHPWQKWSAGGGWGRSGAPDWLLIYQVDGNELILFLTRTGTHADLLGM